MGITIDPRGLQLFVVQIIFFVVVWVFALLRLAVKTLVVKRISVDDWFMFSAVVMYTAHTAITLWGIVYSSAEAHGDFARGENIALHSWFLCEVLYAPLSAAARTSIGVLLLRIATAMTHRRIIWASLVAVWVLSLVYMFLLLFQCSPIDHFYEQVLGQSGSCINKDIVPRATIAHSVISGCIDILLALLPVAMLWHVQLSKRAKAGVAALLSLGLLAGVALFIRIPYVRFIPVSSPEFLDQTDGTAFWSVMETSLGIIAGCASTLRPLSKLWRLGPVKNSSIQTQGAVSRRPGSPRTTLEIHIDKDDQPLPDSPIYNICRDTIPERTPEHEDRRAGRNFRLHHGTPSLGSLTSGVHVETNIEVTRELQSEARCTSPLGPFPSLGDNIISIKSPANRRESSPHSTK